jgi:hypothetical protein
MSILLAAEILIIIFILTLLCLLLVPFYLLIDIRKDGPLVSAWYKLAWFGLPLYKRSIFGSAYEIMTERHQEKATIEERETEDEGLMRLSDLPPLLGGIPALVRACNQLLGSIRMEKFSCHIHFGLSDPADTAVYSGCLWPFVAALNSWGAHLFLQPCFEGEVLEGALAAELKASLIWFILPLLKVLREENARRLLQMARGQRR